MEESQQQQQSQSQAKERERVANPAQVLEESSNKLAKFGGFDILEAVIDGVQNMNPERKARKKIFLTESDKKQERDSIKKSLQLWADLLQNSDNISAAVDQAQQKSDSAAALLKKNLLKAVDATRDLERSYRAVALFYKNTDSDKLKNVTVWRLATTDAHGLYKQFGFDAIAKPEKLMELIT